MSEDTLNSTDEISLTLNKAPVICELCKEEIKTTLVTHWMDECSYFKLKANEEI